MKKTEKLRGELHKSEVFLIASPLLVVKAENIYRNTIKMHKTMETELSHQTAFKQLKQPFDSFEASAYLYGEE